MGEAAKEPPRPGRRGGAGIALAVSVAGLAVVAVLTFLLWPLADLIAAHDVEHLTGPERGKELRVARDAARGRVIQVLAGVLALGGFVYTARTFNLARQQSELNRQTLELAMLQAREQTEATRRSLEQSENAQLTDRFMRAVDQLGNEAADIRLGGIHSLERIARDSPRDHPAVMEALAAFVRRTSQSRPGAATQVPQDLQAAMTALARRLADADQGRLRLHGARLDRLDLVGADLAGADLSGAVLAGADLTAADLGGATLTGADLRGARLDGARLGGARLDGVLLKAAGLRGADLIGAELGGADLGGANLQRARLTGVRAVRAGFARADLTEADLTRADLTEADLSGALLRDGGLAGAVLRRATLSGARAERLSAAGADLAGAVASDTCLTQADLSGCDLTDANLSGAELRQARLDGVDLTAVKLAGLDLTDAMAADGARVPSGWQRAPDGRLARRPS
ncbi:pentapeptide repeat-containing protein [Nonomuraea sp. NPDC047897]|uniref:pentapeptide repeat-containing protein n=1 Tax=Nonomuraea sp. NPDC047897 TaxID=3364346 RepID=UPI003713E56E